MTRYESRKKTWSFYIPGYVLELIIKIWQFEKKIFKIWQIWVIFSMKNPLYWLKIIFFRSKSGENSPVKETLNLTLALTNLVQVCMVILGINMGINIGSYITYQPINVSIFYTCENIDETFEHLSFEFLNLNELFLSWTFWAWAFKTS